MDPARERRILDAFDAAVGWPEQSRDARLAALFADAPDLAGEVRALLAAERDADLLPTRAPEFAEPSAQPAPPERVGAYRLSEVIGRGGMGLVYRGERIHGGFEQAVAIKLIRGGLFSAASAAQFARERQILARLHHPHITQLYDGGLTDDGQSYIVMELVEGSAILDHVQAARLILDDRLDLFADICDAIDYAHREGVVHADIKPSNIIVDVQHGVKLLDFGIAKLSGAAGAAGNLTATGANVLTPCYGAPEQFRGGAPTAATDVFSLGVVLFKLITGTHPYFPESSEGRTAGACSMGSFGAMFSRPAPSLRKAIRRIADREHRLALCHARGAHGIGEWTLSIAPELERIVAMALQREQNARYVQASDFLGELRAHLASWDERPRLGFRNRVAGWSARLFGR